MELATQLTADLEQLDFQEADTLVDDPAPAAPPKPDEAAAPDEAMAPEKPSEARAPEKSSEAVAPHMSSEAGAPQMSSEVAAPQMSSEAGAPQMSSEVAAPQMSSEAGAPQMSSEVVAATDAVRLQAMLKKLVEKNADVAQMLMRPDTVDFEKLLAEEAAKEGMPPKDMPPPSFIPIKREAMPQDVIKKTLSEAATLPAQSSHVAASPAHSEIPSSEAPIAPTSSDSEAELLEAQAAAQDPTAWNIYALN